MQKRKSKRYYKDGHLNTQQWITYKFIKAHPNCYSEEIALNCGYEIDNDSKKRNLARASRVLYDDIEYINNSPEIEKVIVWDTENCYRVANDYEDVLKFWERIYYKPALTKLKKGSTILKKARLDGQGKLISTRGDLIDKESKARVFVEAFNNNKV